MANHTTAAERYNARMDRIFAKAKELKLKRNAELIERYAYPGATLAEAEKAASGYMLVNDESQVVDDDTLASDIDEMRAKLGIR